MDSDVSDKLFDDSFFDFEVYVYVFETKSKLLFEDGGSSSVLSLTAGTVSTN